MPAHCRPQNDSDEIELGDAGDRSLTADLSRAPLPREICMRQSSGDLQLVHLGHGRPYLYSRATCARSSSTVASMSAGASSPLNCRTTRPCASTK